MHKSFSKKNQGLSKVLAVNKYLLTRNEKLKFYNQCKKTTWQKFDVVNLGMIFFFIVCQRKNIYIILFL